MTTKPTPDFPDWIPSAARDKILEWRQLEDSTPEELDVLDRLATYEVMHTEVWQSLPPSAAGMEGRIIDWTVAGLRLADATFPKNKAKSEHLAKYRARRTVQDAATLASNLLEAMDENRQNAERTWEAYSQTTWRKGYEQLRQLYGKQIVEMVDLHAVRPTLSYLEARNVVEWLTHFFKVFWAEDQAVAAALQPPRIRKKQAANVKELYLSRFLTQRFINQFDDPYDPIVGALVGVALDLEHGPDAVKIRGRRRRQRKISSKKRR
jgi:hypothetical protein